MPLPIPPSGDANSADHRDHDNYHKEVVIAQNGGCSSHLEELDDLASIPANLLTEQVRGEAIDGEAVDCPDDLSQVHGWYHEKLDFHQDRDGVHGLDEDDALGEVFGCKEQIEAELDSDPD